MLYLPLRVLTQMDFGLVEKSDILNGRLCSFFMKMYLFVCYMVPRESHGLTHTYKHAHAHAHTFCLLYLSFFKLYSLGYSLRKASQMKYKFDDVSSLLETSLQNKQTKQSYVDINEDTMRSWHRSSVLI